MKSSHKSRKSIRYSIFIGVLAGSVFSGSSAFANVYTLSSISLMVAEGDVTLVAGATYTAGLPTDEGFLVSDRSAYFDYFFGTFAGNGATITGLTVPLFTSLGGQVSELVLVTDSNGVFGNGSPWIQFDGNIQSHTKPITVTMVSEHIQKTKMATGSLKVSP
jgi:hypothetical protein